MMKVSVIIPTYNGANKILEALRGLEVQNSMPDEVIVVIDGSTDGTVDLLGKTQLNLPNLKIIEQVNSGRARVRNRGAEDASGDLLVFLDDDMLIPQQWLSAHIEHHRNIDNSILCGKLEATTEGHQSEFIVFEKWQNNKWNKNISEEREDVIQLSSPYLTAGNFSISKTLFFSLGKFDVRLNDAEDYDLSVRAFKHNYSIYFSPKAFAYHNDLSLKDFRKYIERLRQYREAQKQLAKYKPELYAGEESRFPATPTGIKRKMFELFATRFWINTLEKGSFKWLPKKIRCKLYDVIVTANGVFFVDRVRL
jgi:glycosyltransferase involved in cell wall biosynthesis